MRLAGDPLPMRNPISIQRLVLASAAHPRRTIAAWVVAAALAIFSVVALLGGSLSTDNHPTDNRQSQRAPQLRALAGRLPHGAGTSVPSPDRHSLLIPIDIPGSSAADDVVSAVKRADASPAFTAAVTGDQTRQRDFN